jgi:stage IV sporulation protein FB
MSWSFKLFRIRSIDVKVHLTFVFILVWAAYRWGTSTGQGWLGALFGVVVTLLLFAAVTLHELGHSFQALKYGVRVRGITLLPVGGMAEMEDIPQKPVQELRIALAGPLVNFTIFALLVGLSLILQAKALLTPGELREALGQASWAGMLAYLTAANLLLGLFNLIPAFPMDGGRVLRALLALRLDYRRATKIAVRVG